MKPAWLFPSRSRQFPGKRWANILLRTAHLIGIAGCGASFLISQDSGALGTGYFQLALSSGMLLTLLSIWSNGIFLIQIRGQAILVKLILLGLIPFLPQIKAELFLSMIILSGLIAHAPGNLRYFSLFHGRRIDAL